MILSLDVYGKSVASNDFMLLLLMKTGSAANILRRIIIPQKLGFHRSHNPLNKIFPIAMRAIMTLTTANVILHGGKTVSRL